MIIGARGRPCTVAEAAPPCLSAVPYRRYVLGVGEGVVQGDGQVADHQQHHDQAGQHHGQVAVPRDDLRAEGEGDHGAEQRAHHAQNHHVRQAILDVHL